MIQISTYASERDNEPDQAELTWEALAGVLGSHTRTPCTPETCAGKECAHKNGEAWSPAVVEGTRANKNVRAVTAAVFDLDDVTPRGILPRSATWPWFVKLCTDGLDGLIHSTHSYREDAPRLRLVLPLSRPAKPEEWRHVWLALIARYSLPADRQCKDLSRLYFNPTAPTGAPVESYRLPGRAVVDVDARLVDPLPPDLKAVLGHSTPSTEPGSDGDLGPAPPAILDAARRRLAAHGPALLGQAGNAHTRAAWGILENDFALRDDEARALLLEWNETCQPPWDEGDLFRGPARPNQAWDGTRGEARVRTEFTVGVDQWRLARTPPVNDDTVPTPSVGATPVPVLALQLDEVALEEAPPVRTYPTKSAALNRLLGGGAKTRQLLVVAAPPAAGKSAFAVDEALAFERNGLPVLYVSTELERDEILARCAANILGVSWTDIVGGRVDRARVRDAVAGRRIAVLGSEQLSIDGEESLRQIGQAVQATRDRYGVAPLVVVDYLQDLARGGQAGNERQQVGKIATRLRALAQAFDCCVWAVSSVSRAYYGQAKQEAMRASEDPTAYMAAAKESGDVDFAAATILFLDVDFAAEGARDARIAVAKCRHGRTGFAGAAFDGATGRWREDGAATTRMAAGGSVATDRARKEDERVEARVLEVARQAALSGAPMMREDLLGAVGGTTRTARDAVTRLLGVGRLVMREFESVTKDHRRYRRKALVPTDVQVPGEATGPPREDAAPDPSLAGWTRRAAGTRRDPGT